MSGADTAWILTSTALVLFMTLPGLALFYAGLVRAQNVLSVLMNCFAIACVISIVWLVLAYSIAFGDGGAGNQWWGGLGKWFLAGVGVDTLREGTQLPESLFFMFQMTFAIITPALIVGAYVERIHFAFVIAFSVIWVLLVYAPVVHWVWGGGFLADMGVIDFAGGIVVHVTAGVSSLVLAMMLGRRRGFPSELQPPHNPGMTMIGAAMLWVGWFGFNAGSALAANGAAGMAMLVTQIASATAAVTWMLVEWIKHGKPSVLGIVTGAVGGLVAITPACGSVGPMGAIAIGLAAGCLCFWGATSLKHKLGYDDSLDAFGVHGIGGMVGAVLTGVFAAESLGGVGLAEGMTIGSQVWAQIAGVLFTIVYCGVLSFVILKIVDAIVGLRVAEEEEDRGLDISLHNEQGYYSEV